MGQAVVNQDTLVVAESNDYQDILEQIVLVKKTTANFPILDLEQDNTAFVVFEELEEWRRLIRRYRDDLILDGAKLEDLAMPKNIEHLVIIGDSTTLNNGELWNSWKGISTSVVFLGAEQSVDSCLLTRVDDFLLLSSDSNVAKDLGVQAIFGAVDITGRLQADVSSQFKKDTGITQLADGKLRYSPAEYIGLNGQFIKHNVDSIVNQAINLGAFPGCRVLVSIKGHVVFNESYGYHTYNKRIRVRQHDVYDLASVTKITGPLPLIMKAVDERLIELDQPFANYWEDWKGGLFHRSNKETLTFREVLAHQARLMPYINYYPMTLKDKAYNPKWYSILPHDSTAFKIDDNVYLSSSFKKKLYKAIRKSPLLDEAKYKYSGLSYMLYPELLTNVFNQDYEQILYDSIYKPLGASSLCYNPINRVNTSRLVPTEHDRYFRKKELKGWVHDEAAAIMGGVSGNAGLFSSADDLAKVMQMYLNKGTYAGKDYISKATFDEFTKVQYPDNENRRGAGFDKPLFGNDTLSIDDSYPAPSVSSSSYGHSGFTGTFVWIDPEYELVYIFLSNRVYPTRENPLIYRMNVRPSIQQIFYDALKKGD